MFNRLIFVILSILPLLAFAEQGNAMRSGKALGLFQTVGLAEDGYQSSFIGRIGTTQYTNETGLSLSKNGTSVDPSSAVGVVPYVPYNPVFPLSQKDLLARAKAYQAYAISHTLINDMRTYMHKVGASEVMYSYRQRVKVSGNPVPKVITWRVIIDAFGTPHYNDPKLISDIPTFVYIAYTPKTVMAGLPQTWAYPDAGKYKWNLVDKNFNNLTAFTLVDTNGAYDEPIAQTVKPYTSPYPSGCSIDTEDASGDMVCDPDYALKCLINKTSDAGCPTAYSDILTLIDEYGADGAFIDYSRQLQPVFDTVDNGDGTTSEVARVAVSIDTRTWVKGKIYFFISPTGGASFKETGRNGYTLLNQVDRYGVQMDGSYDFMNTNTTTTISPTQNFSKSVTPPKGAKCINYGFSIIDPFTTNTVYDWRNDTVNSLPQSAYTYVAPLNCY